MSLLDDEPPDFGWITANSIRADQSSATPTLGQAFRAFGTSMRPLTDAITAVGDAINANRVTTDQIRDNRIRADQIRVGSIPALSVSRGGIHYPTISGTRFAALTTANTLTVRWTPDPVQETLL